MLRAFRHVPFLTWALAAVAAVVLVVAAVSLDARPLTHTNTSTAPDRITVAALRDELAAVVGATHAGADPRAVAERVADDARAAERDRVERTGAENDPVARGYRAFAGALDALAGAERDQWAPATDAVLTRADILAALVAPSVTGDTADRLASLAEMPPARVEPTPSSAPTVPARPPLAPPTLP